MRNFKVISVYESGEEIDILNEKELRDLANYYNDHQDIAADINYNDVELSVVIAFIETIDKVEEI